MKSTQPLQFLKDGTVAGYNKEYRCHMFQYPDDFFTQYVFETRYFAQKWINDFVPEEGRKIWKIFEINGYYRIFRYMEYDAPAIRDDWSEEED